MMRFEDARNLAEKELGPLPAPTTPKYEWVGYKNGGVVSRSSVSAEDAMKIGDTKLIEKITVNKDEIDARLMHSRKLETRAHYIWRAALRKDYSHIPTKLFDLCYDQAYDESHSYGHDEVASKLDDVVSFAEKVLEAAGKGL